MAKKLVELTADEALEFKALHAMAEGNDRSLRIALEHHAHEAALLRTKIIQEWEALAARADFELTGRERMNRAGTFVERLSEKEFAGQRLEVQIAQLRTA